MSGSFMMFALYIPFGMKCNPHRVDALWDYRRCKF